MVILAFDLSVMGLSAAMLHQTAYISDKGLPSALLATNMVVFGISATVGSLFWGFLAERFPVRYCVAACFFVSAGGLAILITAQSLPLVFVYVVAYGVGAGGFAPLDAIIIANYYGRTFIGTIRGVLIPLRLIGTTGGPPFLPHTSMM